MIKLVNKCSEYYAYSVPSDSGREDYEVWIDRHTGWVCCTCMDSQCRGKGDWFFTLLAGDSVRCCKHQSRFFETIRGLLIPEETQEQSYESYEQNNL